MLSRLINLAGGRFGGGVLWNLIGTVFSQGSAFITAILLARVLGKEVFGEFGMIQSTMLTLAGIAQVSTGLMATKYVAEFRDSDKVRAGRILGLCSMLTSATGGVAFAVLLLFASVLSDRVLHAPDLAFGLGLASLFVLFSVMNGYQIGALAGLEAFRSVTVVGVFLGLVHLGVCWLGAYVWGLEGAIGGMGVSALLRWQIYGMLLRRSAALHGIIVERGRGAFEWPLVRRFAIPAALAGITTLPSIWLGNAFLVRQENGFAEMGVYSAAISLRTVVLFLPAMVNGVAISIINSHKGLKNKGLYQRTFSINLGVSAVLACTGAAVLWLFGAQALKIFGTDFKTEYMAMMITFMSISVAVEAINIAVYQLIQSHEKMWMSFFLIALPRDILVMVSAYFLTASHGAAGLAAAVLIGHMAALMAEVVLAGKMKLFQRI